MGHAINCMVTSLGEEGFVLVGRRGTGRKKEKYEIIIHVAPNLPQVNLPTPNPRVSSSARPSNLLASLIALLLFIHPPSILKPPHSLSSSNCFLFSSPTTTLLQMVSVEEIRNAQRSHGPATILAFGTATPSNCVSQEDYPDYYFRITNSEHMTDLKEKFKRMCT